MFTAPFICTAHYKSVVFFVAMSGSMDLHLYILPRLIVIQNMLDPLLSWHTTI